MLTKKSTQRFKRLKGLKKRDNSEKKSFRENVRYCSDHLIDLPSPNVITSNDSSEKNAFFIVFIQRMKKYFLPFKTKNDGI